MDLAVPACVFKCQRQDLWYCDWDWAVCMCQTWSRPGQRRKRTEKNSRARGEKRAHHPSAHDVKWEALPCALNPLSAGPLIQSQPPPYLIRHQHGRDLQCLPCSFTILCVCLCLGQCITWYDSSRVIWRLMLSCWEQLFWQVCLFSHQTLMIVFKWQDTF